MDNKVTANMLIGDILDLDEGTSKILAEHNMHCVGCPGSALETLEEAANGHGADLEELIFALNNHLDEQ